MLAPPFQAGGQPEDFGFILPRRCHDGDHAGLALRERPRLIDHEGIDALQCLQRLRVLDQHPGRSTAAGPDHDRHRRRQAQGTGARNDEYRHSVDEGVGHPRLGAESGPGEEREHGNQDDNRHEVSRDHVGQALDRGAGPLGLGHHPHDLREHRLRADAVGPHYQTAGAVNRATDDAIIRPLLGGDGLAGNHGLVHRACALDDDAVHGDLLPRPDPEPIADDHPVEGDVLLGAAVKKSAGELGGVPEQHLDGAAGLAPGTQLKHLSQEHEGGDDRRGLKVDGDLAAVAPERGREEVGKEHGDDAIEEGGPGADSDQGEHVQAAVDERGPATLKERQPAPQDYRGRQGELDPEGGPAFEQMCQRPTGNHLRHRDEEERGR